MQKNTEELKAGYDYISMQVQLNVQEQKKEKYEQLKERISQFANINTLEEAKKLSEKILPVAQEINKFNVGTGCCVVINKPDLFRISLDSENEFISYNFV